MFDVGTLSCLSMLAFLLFDTYKNGPQHAG